MDIFKIDRLKVKLLKIRYVLAKWLLGPSVIYIGAGVIVNGLSLDVPFGSEKEITIFNHGLIRPPQVAIVRRLDESFKNQTTFH